MEQKNKNEKGEIMEYKEILNGAKEIKKGKVLSNKTLGICHNVACNQNKSKFISYSLIIYKILSSWNKFSGVKSYPIPHFKLSPKDAFYNTKNLWDRRTQYGKDRWEALDYLIKELEKSIEEQK